jgi:hypothetical protein
MRRSMSRVMFHAVVTGVLEAFLFLIGNAVQLVYGPFCGVLLIFSVNFLIYVRHRLGV